MCGRCSEGDHDQCIGCTHCGCLKSAQFRAYLLKSNPPRKT